MSVTRKKIGALGPDTLNGAELVTYSTAVASGATNTTDVTIPVTFPTGTKSYIVLCWALRSVVFAISGATFDGVAADTVLASTAVAHSNNVVRAAAFADDVPPEKWGATLNLVVSASVTSQVLMWNYQVIGLSADRAQIGASDLISSIASASSPTAPAAGKAKIGMGYAVNNTSTAPTVTVTGGTTLAGPTSIVGSPSATSVPVKVAPGESIIITPSGGTYGTGWVAAEVTL